MSFYEELEKEDEIRKEFGINIGDTVLILSHEGVFCMGKVIGIEYPDPSVGIFGTLYIIDVKVGELSFCAEEHFVWAENRLEYQIFYKGHQEGVMHKI